MSPQENFREILKKSGHKATHSRLAILGVFKKNRNPVSAQEIIAALSSDADLATVYRTLNALKKKGIIKQVDLRHNHAHYELANTLEHHHLICLSCGRIEDIHRCGVETIQNAVLHGSKHFAEIRQHALEFYGVCKSCKSKKETAEITAHRYAPL